MGQRFRGVAMPHLTPEPQRRAPDLRQRPSAPWTIQWDGIRNFGDGGAVRWPPHRDRHFERDAFARSQGGAGLFLREPAHKDGQVAGGRAIVCPCLHRLRRFQAVA